MNKELQVNKENNSVDDPVKRIIVLIHYNAVSGLFYYRIMYRFARQDGKLLPSGYNDRIIHTCNQEDFINWLNEFIDFWNIQPIAESLHTAKKVIEVIEKLKNPIKWERKHVDIKPLSIKERLEINRNKPLDKYIRKSDIDYKEFIKEQGCNPIAKILEKLKVKVTPSVFDELKFNIYTMEQVINIVTEAENIEITSRQFRYYQRLGLLPKPIIEGRNVGTYTFEVPILIKYIDLLQKEGHKIKDIVSIFEKEGLLFLKMSSLLKF